jgi:heme exporter protein D
MWPDLGRYAATVLGAYAVTLVLLAALWLVVPLLGGDDGPLDP